MKKQMTFLLIMLMLLLVGCNNTNNNISMEIVGETTVLEGEQIELGIKTGYENYIPNWYSYDSSIATINSFGVVTGIKEGSSKITLVIGRRSTQVVVNVKKFEVTMTGKSTIEVGDTSPLGITHNSTKDKKIFYSSCDENIVTVDKDGNITGVAEGKAKINVLISGITKEFMIEVVKKGSIIPEPTPLVINVPDCIKYDEVVIVSANREAIWTSSNPEILYVNENNEIVILDMGVATLRATDVNDESCFVEKEITVTSGIARKKIEIYVVGGETTIPLRENCYLKIRILSDEKGTDNRVTWSVDNEKIAVIDKNGVLYAEKNTGVVIVTAVSIIDPSVRAQIKITIKNR